METKILKSKFLLIFIIVNSNYFSIKFDLKEKIILNGKKYLTQCLKGKLKIKKFIQKLLIQE
jgi:hypothetical protein